MLDIFFGISTTPPSKIKWSTPKERKLKQQLLLLENEIADRQTDADAEDEADLAQIRTRFYEHLDSDKGSKGSEEMPIINEPYTKPVALEKAVQYPDPRLKEKLESFIPESCLKEAQPHTVVPDPTILDEVPGSTLNPRAPLSLSRTVNVELHPRLFILLQPQPQFKI